MNPTEIFKYGSFAIPLLMMMVHLTAAEYPYDMGTYLPNATLTIHTGIRCKGECEKLCDAVEACESINQIHAEQRCELNSKRAKRPLSNSDLIQKSCSIYAEKPEKICGQANVKEKSIQATVDFFKSETQWINRTVSNATQVTQSRKTFIFHRYEARVSERFENVNSMCQTEYPSQGSLAAPHTETLIKLVYSMTGAGYFKFNLRQYPENEKNKSKNWFWGGGNGDKLAMDTILTPWLTREPSDPSPPRCGSFHPKYDSRLIDNHPSGFNDGSVCEFLLYDGDFKLEQENKRGSSFVIESDDDYSESCCKNRCFMNWFCLAFSYSFELKACILHYVEASDVHFVALTDSGYNIYSWYNI